MPKIVKLFLFVLFPLVLILGGLYGLAKVGVIPVKKLAKKNRAATMALHLMGLDSPKLPAVHAAKAGAGLPAADPLAAERKALADQKAALAKERADMVAEHETRLRAAAQKTAAPQSTVDPKSMSRLAAIYEQMPAETANKIFAKLPDPEVIALMRKMDEKKVGQILATVPPDRAARLTLDLSKPASPVQPTNTE